MTWPIVLRRVVGDSMLPSLNDGNVIIANRWYRQINVGDVVVVRHNGTEKIKRVRDVGNGKLYIVGDNPGFSTDSRQFGWIPVDSVVAKVCRPVK